MEAHNHTNSAEPPKQTERHHDLKWQLSSRMVELQLLFQFPVAFIQQLMYRHVSVSIYNCNKVRLYGQK